MTDDGAGEAIVRAWLAEMEACVREVAFARCRKIFAPDVVAFGSLGERLVGLETLERDQWRQVWPRIQEFTFILDQVSWGGVVGDGMIWLACPWVSDGTREDGTTFERPGRMTGVLERRNGAWVAVHTHHSVNPKD